MMQEANHIVLGGDVMLGRLVNKPLVSEGAQYPLGDIADLMSRADITIVNLECAITDNTQTWQGKPKAFYFGALPVAVESLVGAGVDVVSLANNHLLDFEVKGLIDTLGYLKQHDIQYTGAGLALAEAKQPTFFSSKGVTFGMVAFCDHQSDFAATEDRPGIAYLDLRQRDQALAEIQASLELMKSHVDWPILSLHWGPNKVDRPSAEFVEIAHAAIDMGYKMLFGHSAHVFHGVAMYRGCPIIYAAGDLVDDYRVGEEFRNDHQLLFELVLTEDRVEKIFLYPVFIHQCRVSPASKEQFDYIARRATALCQEMGTVVERVGDRLVVQT